MQSVTISALMTLGAFAAAIVCTAVTAADEAGLSVSPVSFNPSADQSVELRVAAEQGVGAKVLVYDPDGGLVREIPVPEQEGSGERAVSWDGRDGQGVPVPDQAYSFVVQQADGSILDPAATSGGEVEDIRDPVFDAGGAVSYSLPAPSRVLIRLGIRNGPMYRTLVDWAPRPTGKVTEYWDGFDADGLVRLRGREDFTALVTYVTLPDATVITYGNDTETYRDYKLGRGRDRPQKPEPMVRDDAAGRFRPEGLVPPAWARAPRVTMRFPDLADGNAVPTVRRAVNVRIDVAEADKALLMEDQFEVLLFVDSRFFAEAERGYLPLNWTWELDQFEPGEHVLTVNVASFRGQVGVVSRKVVLER